MGQRGHSISGGSSGGNWRGGDLCRRQAVGGKQRERTLSVLRLGDSGHPDRRRLGIRVGIWFVQNRQGRQRIESVWQAVEGHEKAGRRDLEVRKSYGPA